MTLLQDHEDVVELAQAIPYSLWEQLKNDDLKGDPWGVTMSWLFALAAYMTCFRGMTTPPEWEFQLGVGGPDTDAFELKELRRRNDSKGTLERFGKLLWCLHNLCIARHQDY